MANFETGISSYVHAQAIVDIYFPVDHKGNADISCSQCDMYRESARRCGITHTVCAYPTKYVGTDCPLYRVDDNTGDLIENERS